MNSNEIYPKRGSSQVGLAHLQQADDASGSTARLGVRANFRPLKQSGGVLLLRIVVAKDLEGHGQALDSLLVLLLRLRKFCFDAPRLFTDIKQRSQDMSCASLRY